MSHCTKFSALKSYFKTDQCELTLIEISSVDSQRSAGQSQLSPVVSRSRRNNSENEFINITLCGGPSVVLMEIKLFTFGINLIYLDEFQIVLESTCVECDKHLFTLLYMTWQPYLEYFSRFLRPQENSL